MELTAYLLPPPGRGLRRSSDETAGSQSVEICVQRVGRHSPASTDDDRLQHTGCEQLVGLGATDAEHVSYLSWGQQELVHRSVSLLSSSMADWMNGRHSRAAAAEAAARAASPLVV